MTAEALAVKRDALVSKIADAYVRIEKGDEAITYQSIEQMERALRIVDSEMNVANGSSSARTSLVSHSRG